jgi:tRNA(Ile)-lysidine synthase
MFRRVSKVLVAVSGGADSIACLLVLLGLRERFGFSVEAVHFDHKLRPESAADMGAVRTLCADLGVECVTGEGDVAAVAAKQRQGIEETARMMRYQFLAFVAGKEGADCIATGHTAGDQAETVLMRIARGSGVRGIRGMLPVSGVPGAPERRLVRPLLGTGRVDTEAICAEFGITPIVDPSNADPSYTRNRVRATVLGQLRALNPSVDDALRGLAESAREAFSLIEKRSFEVQPRERGPIGAIFALAPFRDLPSEALTLVIEREAAFYHLKPEVNRTRVENLRAVLAKGTGAVHFGDTVVEASCGAIRLGPRLEPVDPIPAAVLNVPGSTRAGPWRVDVLTSEVDPTPGSPVIALVVGTVKGALRVRPLQPGERMIWHGVVRKVSDMLINEKVPTWERHGMVAVADSAQVLGVFGATRTFVTDMEGEPELWVRLAAIQGSRA